MSFESNFFETTGIQSLEDCDCDTFVSFTTIQVQDNYRILRKKILDISLHKYTVRRETRRDEAILCRSILICNTIKRLQNEIWEEETISGFYSEFIEYETEHSWSFEESLESCTPELNGNLALEYGLEDNIDEKIRELRPYRIEDMVEQYLDGFEVNDCDNNFSWLEESTTETENFDAYSLECDTTLQSWEDVSTLENEDNLNANLVKKRFENDL